MIYYVIMIDEVISRLSHSSLGVALKYATCALCAALLIHFFAWTFVVCVPGAGTHLWQVTSCIQNNKQKWEDEAG